MDLRKSLTARPGEENKTKGDVAKSFRNKVAKPAPGGLAVPDKRTSLPSAYGGKGGMIGFIIDATGSRESTWQEAQSIQRGMFDAIGSAGGMQLRLVHFGGDMLQDHGWKQDPDKVASIMGKVSCIGGTTQIVDALDRFRDQDGKRASTIILVGDSFEEFPDSAFEIARNLAKQGTKIFAFHEGYDPGAEAVFKELAHITGGAFAKFGSDMPLNDLCRAAAVFSSGGSSALRRFAQQGDRAAKQLADSMLRLGSPEAKKGGPKP